MKYIPKRLYKNEYYIQRIIIGFYNKKNSLSLDEIREIFKKATDCNIEDFINLYGFFKEKPNFFKFTDDSVIEIIYKEKNGIIEI